MFIIAKNKTEKTGQKGIVGRIFLDEAERIRRGEDDWKEPDKQILQEEK